MKKKFLLALVLVIITSGMVFAETDFESMAKNTITVDFGPMIIGAAFGVAGGMVGIEGLNSSGFGIGVQYERQLFKRLSVAGRFAYMGVSLGVPFEDTYTEKGVTVTTNAEAALKLSSFSLEGHVRFYPSGGPFFLSGMLGYANMSAVASGSMIITDDYGHNQKEAVSFNVSNGYFKFGAKIGWRISFGRNGGVTFEPAFGYSFGLGSSFADKLLKEVGGDIAGFDGSEEVNFILDAIPGLIFVGGPRVTLALGYRF